MLLAPFIYLKKIEDKVSSVFNIILQQEVAENTGL